MASPKKHYLITGAAGMVGSLLTERLLEDANNVVFMTDVVEPAVPAGARYPANARPMQGDLCAGPAAVERVVAAGLPLAAVFVLHGVMSGASEANPALSLAVNLDATRALLLQLAEAQRGVRVVYASSNAVYGPPLPAPPAQVNEATTPTPTGVYGTCKYMVEVLINDLTRRGLLDAYSVRFPTLSVRPGKPAPAASAFLSGIIREPLHGQVCSLPLADRQFRATLSSPQTCIDNLLRVAAWPSSSSSPPSSSSSLPLPSHIRAINFPGIVASVQDLIDALATVAGPDKLALIRDDEPNAAYEALLRSWAWNIDYSFPLSLGLKQDKDVESLVREYVDWMEKVEGKSLQAKSE